jgi:DNA (cytosine-5)-methyltransferase 1
MELTHASFFSGVGGLDLGLERAGWRTVSFSEIDPYASAVLAERWPGVPNLGDITALSAGSLRQERGRGRDDRDGAGQHADAAGRPPERTLSDPWTSATLWSGGFPCQDLSVAGKRRGMGTEDERTRSGLAYSFLNLVERHRPPAILLENVPGLLSSNAGRDFGALLGRLAELGYGWAYRILDAQFFGVPQRRRRVFILALHAGAGFGADSPAAVLSVGSRCDGHSAAGDEARTGVAASVGNGIAPPVRAGGHGDPGIGRDNDHDRLIFNATASFGQWEQEVTAGNLSARDHKSTNHLVSSSPDPDRVREADGLAGRLDGGQDVAGTLLAPGAEGGRRDKIPLALTFRKATRVGLRARPDTGRHRSLPLGLDSHRYRCCGNGVVSNVSEWIGVRLARAFA